MAALPTFTSLRAGAPLVFFRRSLVALVDIPNAFQFSVCLLFDSIIPYFQCPRSVAPASPNLSLLNAPLCAASSTRPRPLKRVAHPTAVDLKILPRRQPLNERLVARHPALVNTDPNLKHTDSIRISISAFEDTFHLHLTPNNDLLHPSAHVKYFKTAPDGRSTVLDRIEPIHRESILIFGGKVIHDDYTQAALLEDDAGGIWRPYGLRAPGERGWARITVHDGGDPTTGRPPVFEGAFSVDGVIHHVNTKDNYRSSKLALDPDPYPLDDTNLVIFRDSDIVSIEEEEHLSTGEPLSQTRKKRPPMSCSHDRLGYNVAKDNPVLRWGAGLDRSQQTWLDVFGLNDHRGRNGSLLPRQGDINDAGGNMSSNFVGTIGSIAGCPTTQQIVRPCSLGGYNIHRFYRYTWALLLIASIRSRTVEPRMRPSRFSPTGTLSVFCTNRRSTLVWGSFSCKFKIRGRFLLLPQKKI